MGDPEPGKPPDHAKSCTPREGNRWNSMTNWERTESQGGARLGESLNPLAALDGNKGSSEAAALARGSGPGRYTQRRKQGKELRFSFPT